MKFNSLLLSFTLVLLCLCSMLLSGCCNHTWEKTSEEAASCQKTGKITYTCSKCGEQKTETIAQMSHQIVEVIEERVEPTLMSNGSYELVQRCSMCQVEFSREQKIIYNDRLYFENAYKNMWKDSYSASFSISFTHTSSGTTSKLNIAGQASCFDGTYSGDGTISGSQTGDFSFPFQYVYPFYTDTANPDFPLLQLKGTDTNAIYLPVNLIQPGDGLLKMMPDSAFETMIFKDDTYSFTLTESEYISTYAYLMAFIEQYASSLNIDLTGMSYPSITAAYTIRDNMIKKLTVTAKGEKKRVSVELVMNIEY